LADADFSPSKQTASVISYEPQPSSVVDIVDPRPILNGTAQPDVSNEEEHIDDVVDVDSGRPSGAIPDLLGSELRTEDLVCLKLPDLTEVGVEASTVAEDRSPAFNELRQEDL